IMSEKTSYHVVSSMFETIGMIDVLRSRSDAILVVAIGDIEQVIEVVERQKYVKATVISEQKFAGLPSEELRTYDYIAAISSEYNYSNYYLAGRFAGFVYTKSEFITQKAQYHDSQYLSGPIHEYVDSTEARLLTMVSTDKSDAHDFMSGKI